MTTFAAQPFPEELGQAISITHNLLPDLEDYTYQVYGPRSDEMRRFFEDIITDTSETLDTISPEERSGLKLVFLPTAHTPQFAQEAIAGLLDADVVLFESVGLSERQRNHCDVITNLALRGFTIGSNPNSLTSVQMAMLEENTDWRSMVMTGITNIRPAPIFRSIDMASDDPDFAENIHGPKGLQFMDDPDAIYTMSLKKLRSQVSERLPIGARNIRERDDEMYDDISKVAAQAVRMIGPGRHITIGVATGAVHSMIARKFERLGLDVEQRWSGPGAKLNDDVFGGTSAYYSFNLENALLRKAAYLPDAIDNDDIDCLLTYWHVRNTLQYTSTPEAALRAMVDFNLSHVLDMVASEIVYSMSVAQRSSLLKELHRERPSVFNPFFKSTRGGLAKVRMTRLTSEHIETSTGPVENTMRRVITELLD